MFPVYDVSASIADRPETLGSKEKLWLTPQSDLPLPPILHLFKVGRPNTGENWSEKAACELARTVGLPCAAYDLAVCDGTHGVLSPSFLPAGSPFIPANTIFSRVNPEYDGTLRFRQARYKLLTALHILQSFRLEPVEIDSKLMTALDVFVGYLVFDALIGNTDRHHENWGVVVLRRGAAKDTAHLAPSFDHASCLGRELTDDRRRQRLQTRDVRGTVEAYAEKARSAFYGPGTGSQTMTSREVVATLKEAFPIPTTFWAAKTAALSRDNFVQPLDGIPPEFISPPAREFAATMLVYNQQMIREIALG